MNDEQKARKLESGGEACPLNALVKCLVNYDYFIQGNSRCCLHFQVTNHHKLWLMAG